MIGAMGVRPLKLKIRTKKAGRLGKGLLFSEWVLRLIQPERPQPKWQALGPATPNLLENRLRVHGISFRGDE